MSIFNNKQPQDVFNWVNKIALYQQAPVISEPNQSISSYAITSITQTNNNNVSPHPSKKRKVTDATKDKMSKSHQGHTVSDETKRKISEAQKKQFAKQKLSGEKKKWKRSDETKRKISEAQKKQFAKQKLSGEKKKWKRSDATIRNISEAQKKRYTGPKGEDARKQLSEAHKGHTVSDATRKKISETYKGHTVSDATREKMSKAQKERRRKSRGEETKKNPDDIIHSVLPDKTSSDREILSIKEEPNLNNKDSDCAILDSSTVTRKIDDTLPVLQKPEDKTQSLLYQAEGEIENIKVSKWGYLNKRYLNGTTSEKKKIHDTIKNSMREWLILSEEKRTEYTNRLRDIYKISTPIDIGPFRGESAFAKRDIKAFEVLGPYSGVLHDGEETFSQVKRQHGPRNISAYLFETSSSHRFVDGFNSGNQLSLVNTAQLGDDIKIGANNISVVLFGKNINFYVANKNIPEGEEFFINYGPHYNFTIKNE